MLWSVRWIVDGMNVIGSRPDGWWRDRAAARRRLVGELAATAQLPPGLRTPPEAGSSGGESDPVKGTLENDRWPGGPLTVVFDGRDQGGEVTSGAQAGVEVVFAPGGPDAADRVIVQMVASTDDPAGTVVVTSDRALAREVSLAGATVVGTSTLKRLLTPRAGDA